jgi:hypothetical protein
VPVSEVSLDDAQILVDSLAFEEKELSPGEVANLAVYFRSVKKTKRDLKFQVEIWLEDGPNKTRSAKSRFRLTGAGMFPTSRWHPGELVRDRFKVTLPANWKTEKDGQEVLVGLRIRASGNEKPSVQGPLRTGTTDLVVIGSFKLSNSTPVPEPAPVPAPPAPGKGPKTERAPTKAMPVPDPGARGMVRQLQGKLKMSKPEPVKSPGLK